MEYNFDILLAGCNTNCLHCYVDGGPSKHMPYEDYLVCLEKLNYIFDKLEGKSEVTLDNELFNHPRAKDIILKSRERLRNRYFHHGSTTGIAFMNRSDKEEIAKALLSCGCSDISLTIHGNEKRHNEIVKNSQGFAMIKKAANYFYSKGFEVFISLMLSKYLVEDKDEISNILEETPHHQIYFAIPNYVPTDRMREYQSIRANYEDCLKLKGYVDKWGWDEATFMDKVEKYNEKSIYDKLKSGFDFVELKKECQENIYLNIDQELNLYYGNTGASTKFLGNLKSDNLDKIVEKLSCLKPNYAYSSYYDMDILPKSHELMDKMNNNISNNYVYPSTSECIHRWLDFCGIKNLIINK